MDPCLTFLLILAAWAVLGFLGLLVCYFKTPLKERVIFDPIGKSILTSCVLGPTMWIWAMSIWLD